MSNASFWFWVILIIVVLSIWLAVDSHTAFDGTQYSPNY